MKGGLEEHVHLRKPCTDRVRFAATREGSFQVLSGRCPLPRPMCCCACLSNCDIPTKATGRKTSQFDSRKLYFEGLVDRFIRKSAKCGTDCLHRCACRGHAWFARARNQQSEANCVGTEHRPHPSAHIGPHHSDRPSSRLKGSFNGGVPASRPTCEFGLRHCLSDKMPEPLEGTTASRLRRSLEPSQPIFVVQSFKCQHRPREDFRGISLAFSVERLAVSNFR